MTKWYSFFVLLCINIRLHSHFTPIWVPRPCEKSWLQLIKHVAPVSKVDYSISEEEPISSTAPSVTTTMIPIQSLCSLVMIGFWNRKVKFSTSVTWSSIGKHRYLQLFWDSFRTVRRCQYRTDNKTRLVVATEPGTRKLWNAATAFSPRGDEKVNWSVRESE